MKNLMIGLVLGLILGVVAVLIWNGRYDYPVDSKILRYDKWTQTPQMYKPLSGWVDGRKSE